MFATSFIRIFPKKYEIYMFFTSYFHANIGGEYKHFSTEMEVILYHNYIHNPLLTSFFTFLSSLNVFLIHIKIQDKRQ